MKLTKSNYFTIRNKYITNSKITDWFKDKNYLYRKHVLGEVPEKITDAMLIGKAVDLWLTDSEKAFREKFIKVSRRNLQDPPKDYYELPISQYEKVEVMCQKIQQQKIFKQLKGFHKQKILQTDMPLGLFEGYAGIPDWFKIKDKTAIIVDLKTAPSIVPAKYYYHCLDYNYFRQQAMYQILVKDNFKEVEEFISYHIVFEKDTDDIFDVGIFVLDQERIEKEKQIINAVLFDISNERKFLPKDISFADALPLGSLSYENE